jgi:predicted metal-dependent phosphoesterase TrpH
MREVDLHVHTTASDGTMSPAEIVRYAKEKGLLAIAITDHDTIEGLQEAIQEGDKQGLEVIPGVELSVDFPKGTMHLLGYYIDPLCPELIEKLTVLQQARRERNLKIIESLRALGIPMELSEVKAAPGHGQIGRPHFAYTLVNKGYARNIQDAFDRYLRKGGPAYVEKFRFTPQEALAFIAMAGGITVLAHPFTLNLPQPQDIESLLVELKGKGLDGVEVYYPEHSEGQTKVYRYLAQRYGLLATGGSDFHGLTKEDVDLGEGYGDGEVTYALVEAMKARRELKLKEVKPYTERGEVKA